MSLASESAVVGVPTRTGHVGPVTSAGAKREKRQKRNEALKRWIREALIAS